MDSENNATHIDSEGRKAGGEWSRKMDWLVTYYLLLTGQNNSKQQILPALSNPLSLLSCCQAQLSLLWNEQSKVIFCR